MATLLPIRPHPVLSPFLDRTRIPNHPLLLHHRTNYGYGGTGDLSSIRRKQFHSGDGAGVVNFGVRSRASFLGSAADGAEEVIKELFGRAEAVLYTVAYAAVSSSDTVTVTTTGTTQSSSDWLSGITNYMEIILKVMSISVFEGWAHDCTCSLCFWFCDYTPNCTCQGCHIPLTKKQERIQLETARMYKLAGINPLAASSKQ